MKISVISRMRSMSKTADIINTRDEIFLIFTKKSKFSFICSVKEIPLRGKAKLFS